MHISLRKVIYGPLHEIQSINPHQVRHRGCVFLFTCKSRRFMRQITNQPTDCYNQSDTHSLGSGHPWQANWDVSEEGPSTNCVAFLLQINNVTKRWCYDEIRLKIGHDAQSHAIAIDRECDNKWLLLNFGWRRWLELMVATKSAEIFEECRSGSYCVFFLVSALDLANFVSSFDNLIYYVRARFMGRKHSFKHLTSKKFFLYSGGLH